MSLAGDIKANAENIKLPVPGRPMSRKCCCFFHLYCIYNYGPADKNAQVFRAILNINQPLRNRV